MKISNSKKELARIISENGGWRDEAKWSVQHKTDGRVVFTKSKYKPEFNDGCWDGFGTFYGGFVTHKALPNWHQCILSSEEYFHLYPAPDAGGWIEWKGGECPVERGTLVDVKFEDDMVMFGAPVGITGGEFERHLIDWSDDICDGTRIIAYRLHKPEQEGTTEKLSPEAVSAAKDALMSESIEEIVRKPTIEQLAADYRNRKDYADRKQREADSAKSDAEAKLDELVAAGKAIGLVVSVDDVEPELVITDWRDLQVGDEIEIVESTRSSNEGRTGVVSRFGKTDEYQPVRVIFNGSECDYDWPIKWRFISRP